MSQTPNQPDPWLRGPVPGIPALLQPAAHALIAAREEIERTLEGLGADDLWARPGGAASIGFHVAHLAGSTDRLFTYARGEVLSEGQRADLTRERSVQEARPTAESLLMSLSETIDRGLAQLGVTDVSTLAEARPVGRAASSTVLGLLFHAADHAARHAGQVVTTAKIVRAARESAPTTDC